MTGDCEEVQGTRGAVDTWSNPGQSTQAGFRLFYNSYGCNLAPLQPRQKQQQAIFSLTKEKGVKYMLHSSEVSRIYDAFCFLLRS